MKTKLTVVVPLYNTREYIKECIQSIQNQSYTDIKIIIVDDGSTDGGELIAEEMASRDDRISVIHQENGGLSKARFAGIEACKTEYITFVDADDFVTKNSFVFAKEYMDLGIEMIAFEIARYFNDSNIKIEGHIVETGYYDRKKIEEQLFPRLVWNFSSNTPGFECSQAVKIVKTELLKKVYDDREADVFYGEDIAITYPLIYSLKSLQIVKECYYMHRQRKVSECPPCLKSDKCFDECYQLYKHLVSKLCNGSYEESFRKQVDYLYIHLVELKKNAYGDTHSNNRFLFPFDKVPYNKKVLLYGAGDKGREYYNQLKKLNYCKELVWVDKNADNIENEKVVDPSIVVDTKFDYSVIAIENREVCEQVKQYLILHNVKEEAIVY